jgi:hypothetical protein
LGLHDGVTSTIYLLHLMNIPGHSCIWVQGEVFILSALFNEAFGESFDEEKIDIYVTVMSGLEIRNYSSNFDSSST